MTDILVFFVLMTIVVTSTRMAWSAIRQVSWIVFGLILWAGLNLAGFEVSIKLVLMLTLLSKFLVS